MRPAICVPILGNAKTANIQAKISIITLITISNSLALPSNKKIIKIASAKIKIFPSKPIVLTMY